MRQANVPIARDAVMEAKMSNHPNFDRALGDRGPESRPGPDGLDRSAPVAGCPDGDRRGQAGPPRAGVHVGMRPAPQRGGAADRSRPLRWVRSLDGYRLAGSLPAPDMSETGR